MKLISQSISALELHACIFSYVEEKNMRFFYNKKIQLTQHMYIQNKSKKLKNTIINKYGNVNCKVVCFFCRVDDQSIRQTLRSVL